MFFVPLASMAQIEIKDAGDGAGAGLEGTWDGMQITDYETESYVPVGDALWLLAGAAGLYLLAKSRKTRKATATMAAALALTLGTTQCKKTEESVIPAGETIFISLNGGNGSGSKADINVNTGCITWNADDEVYVVYDGQLLSETPLLATPAPQNSVNANIKGTITTTVTIEGDNPSFTFYYVGSGVKFTPVESTTKLTFEIANQDGLHAGEYMIGRTETIVMEKAGGTYKPKDNPDEARKFTPLTSVLRLNTSGFGPGQMTMSSGNNKMEINLSAPDNPDYTPGNISFAGGKDVQISVMPSTEVNVNATLNFSGNSKQGSIKVKNGIKPGRIYAKIINNASTPILVEAIPEGALPGLFSVSADKQVYFSKGNLQATYTSSNTYTWDFAAHQYGFIGNANGNISIDNQQVGNVVDLFGWSTTSTNYGINNSEDPSTYSGEFYDWGNAIDDKGTWRTLTHDELEHLLDSRTNAENLYGEGIVGDVRGLIILPDDWQWDGDVAEFEGNWNPGNLTWYNQYTEPNWAKMEAAGAVFLPAAGSRTGGNVAEPNILGGYWSSTPNDANTAYDVGFTEYSLVKAYYPRHFGGSVRLVHDVPNTDGTISIDDPGSGGL